MQIHELNTYSGTPGSSDYLAMDNGSETFKVPANELGVSTEMTQAEAETGTETAPRVISPAVLNSFVAESISASVADLLVVEDFISEETSVPGSGSSAITIPVSKTGYKTLGLVGIRKVGTGHSYAVFYNQYVNPDAGNCYIGVRNISENAVTVTVYAKILFVKN